MKTKTGEVLYIDETGALIKATSFVDKNGLCSTELEVLESPLNE